MKTACCVVLYNPDDSTAANISTYAPYVGEVFAVDNSDEPNTEILSKIEASGDNVTVIPMHGNKGIAAALNAGLHEASERGYRYLLTMDDDSYFTDDTLPRYLDKAEKIFASDEKIIQIGIFNSGDKKDDPYVYTETPEWIITSGTLMDVESSIAVGGFLEKLFIDEVDREFSLRAVDSGYKIRRVIDLTMQHNLGAPIKGKILGKSFEAMGHNKIRKYYIFRNCTYVMKTFPRVKKEYKHFLRATLIKTILVEDDKMQKIKYMMMGKRDARNGKFGKLEV